MTNHDYIDNMTDEQLIAMHEEVMGGKCESVVREDCGPEGRDLVFREYGWEAEDETEKRAIDTDYTYSDYGEMESGSVPILREDKIEFVKFMVMTFGQRWINDYFCYQSGISKTELEKLICRNREAGK